MATSRGTAAIGKRTKQHGNRSPSKMPPGRSGGAIHVPLIQQRILDVFVDAFPNLLEVLNVEKNLRPILQEVKKHLYNREFDQAFGRREYLDAYAARWSASRALGYTEIFSEVFAEHHIGAEPGHMKDMVTQIKDLSLDSENNAVLHSTIAITCLGGGAGAELCALAATHRSQSYTDIAFTVSLIDIADWELTLDGLFKSLTSAPPTYAPAKASQAAPSETSGPLISESLMARSFHCMNLLNLSEDDRTVLHNRFHESRLITLMFTLNELYNTSMSKTQALLLDLTSQVKPGAYFLVVDSAGSYSTVTVNRTEKRYPMQWLLDHTLMRLAPAALVSAESVELVEAENKMVNAKGTESGSTGKEGDQRQSGPSPKPAKAHKVPPPVWERETSIDSRWFRLAPDVRYPLDLENMRYQLHLYRRL